MRRSNLDTLQNTVTKTLICSSRHQQAWSKYHTMSKINSVGVLGFGEVGQAIAEASYNVGDDVYVYNRSRKDSLVESPYSVAHSPAEVGAECELVISCVWPASAFDIAKETAEGFNSSRESWFYNLNSVSPGTALRMENEISDSDCTFLNGAIHGSVKKMGTDVKLTLAGQNCEIIAGHMEELGFTIDYMGEDVTRPSALKMCRSIFAKGLRELFVETFLPAMKYGLEDEVMQDLSSVFENRTFDTWMERLITDTPTHAERRYGESIEMRETAHNVGCRSPITEATIDLHRVIYEEGIQGNTYKEILDQLYPHFTTEEASAKSQIGLNKEN